MQNLIIIGSGVAGMAAACRLRAKGFTVTVLEANAYPGGKLTHFRKDGFRFDAGPSLFTMPQLLDDVFIQAGKNPRHYYTFQALNTTCHYFYEDGTRITAYTEPDQLAKELHEKLAVAPVVIQHYLAQAKQTYEMAAHIFLENSLHKRKTWLKKEVARALSSIPKLGIFETMHQRNSRLLHEPRLIQLFDRYATYNGSNPYQAPGILTSIPHLEFNLGTYFPEGGMHSITEALYKLATDLGVTFQFNTRVNEIVVERGITKGVRVGQQFIPATAVVSNMDVHPTYQKLLPTQPTPKRILTQERSSSALIFYWGINRPFPELELHNIFFAENYEEEFNCLFQKSRLHSDPTIYINITSKYCPTDAPPGCENWFVMINAPANKGQPWEAMISQARANIIKKLNRLLATNLENHLVTEDVLNPVLIEQKTSSYQGSLYGTSSNSKMAAFLRHPNFSGSIKNLFFCGGSVHPGGGIPLCLQSARITSDLMVEHFARHAV